MADSESSGQRKAQKRWTTDEVAQLQQYVAMFGHEIGGLQKLFPDRTLNQIRTKVYALERGKLKSQMSISPITSHTESQMSIVSTKPLPQLPAAILKVATKKQPDCNQGWNAIFQQYQ